MFARRSLPTQPWSTQKHSFCRLKLFQRSHSVCERTRWLHTLDVCNSFFRRVVSVNIDQIRAVSTLPCPCMLYAAFSASSSSSPVASGRPNPCTYRAHNRAFRQRDEVKSNRIFKLLWQWIIFDGNWILSAGNRLSLSLFLDYYMYCIVLLR